MDTQRAKKTRSLGANPTSSRQSASTSHTLRRTDQAEKHCSVPASAPRRQSEINRAAEGLKVSDRSRRASKASSRDGSAVPTLTSVGDSQTLDQRRASAVSVKTNTQPTDANEIPILTFAVIGGSKVGKSVFIRNALDLRRPSTTQAATSKVLLGGSLYRLQLVEIPLESVDLARNSIVWSSIPELDDYPNVDGVLCLYDVSERSSVDRVPQLLTALERTSQTTCLVSCKVDIPLSQHEVGPSFIDQVSTAFPSIDVEEASMDCSDSAKRCLLKILKETLVAAPRGSRLPDRARSDSNASSARLPRRNSHTTSSRSRSRNHRQIKRSRSRENLFTIASPPAIESEDEEDTDEEVSEETSSNNQASIKMPLSVRTTNMRPKLRVEKPHTPISSTENVSTRAHYLSDRANAMVPQTPESFADTMLRRGSGDTNDSRSYRTFLDIDDESAADDTSSVKGETESSRRDTASADTSYQGVPFLDLVNRLLTMPATKGDHKFMSSFFCLYRSFATPLSLLISIIDKFVRTEQGTMVVFSKTAELLRYLSVLGSWTARYPGDFASTAVKETALTFLSAIGKNKSFSPAAKQVANNLQTYALDEDEDWAFADGSDSARGRCSTISGVAQSKSDLALGTNGHRRRLTQSKDDEDSDFDHDSVILSSNRHSAMRSSASSPSKSAQVASQASESLRRLEIARENAKKIRVAPQTPIGRSQWDQFMSFSTEELALEFTRIDWTMYTAIRPRDFVRYVTLSNSQRSRLRHVDYIGMMTKHFNHLALFVSGMILVRDKPKHRARIVERFMDLAWKVRRMNNYHALGALVAALSGEEIVRLAQTHELISQDQRKQLLQLKTLMGHQQSHAVYRMAWDNSSGERIPYLPRVQEDLTKAAQGNPTFIGGSKNINWRKFEIMGDTIVSLQKSQEQPYTFPDRTSRGHDIDKLVLETKILEGEDSFDPQQELYERSKLIEPPVIGGAGPERKKFDWLRRQ